jgi:methylated-DNA-[protein]-cysteine S-methyltransferase
MNLNAAYKQYDALINTPFGAVAISAYGNQLAIELLTESPSESDYPSTHPLVATAYAQITAYLQQPTTQFNLPVSFHGTPFQQRVWHAIADIPLGQTRTYGQLAHQIGSGPRAVANACGANNLPLVIPCHRVVAQNGIGGFMQSKQNGLLVKKWLLQHEGVEVSKYSHESNCL